MENDPHRRRRPLRLSAIPNWKHTLIEGCNTRVRQDRMRLLWKLRLSSLPSSANPKEVIQSAFQEIVTDELEKMRDIDDLWEYDGLHDTYQGECEEILLEMQKVFYEDLRVQPPDGDPERVTESWEDAEDEYLARATYEQMLLSENEDHNEVWCPVCKKGLLKQDHICIFCCLCKLRLHKGDEVNLELLKIRLAEAHADHLGRGCRLTPKFSIDSHFGLTALYILCKQCNTFEVVM
uniref:RPA-interacting protein n=1 Tax=Kalanchoe fedtschenkoi TaxID=63787 RepID=A0A7N0UTU2_KALFE